MSIAAVTSAPRPYEMVILGSRSSGVSRCRPQACALSTYAVVADDQDLAGHRPAERIDGRHRDPLALERRARARRRSRGRRRTSGLRSIVSAGATDVQPAAIAPAAGDGVQGAGELVRADQYAHAASHVCRRACPRPCRCRGASSMCPGASSMKDGVNLCTADRQSCRSRERWMPFSGRRRSQCHSGVLWDDEEVTTWVEPSGTATALLLLGRGSDAGSERGVDCPGELPRGERPDLVARARAAKAALGDRVFVLGHHYQRDEVIQFADVTGDSFKLARDAAGPARRRVHRLLRRALHGRERRHPDRRPTRRSMLPDLAAGCSMADMAVLDQVEACWDALTDLGIADVTVPVTYMNSSADIKGFVGRQRRRRLHLLEREAGARLGVRAGPEGAVPARPAPRPQHRGAARWASRSTTACSTTRTSRTAA